MLACAWCSGGLVIGCTDARDPGPATLPDTAEAPSMHADTFDRGIGIIAFDRQLPAGAGGSGRDTILIFRDTTARDVIARYIFRGDEGGASWSWTIEGDPGVESNSMEFDYEVEGLPVDRVTVNARWAMVIHGFGPDGAPREGWVRISPDEATFTRWTSVLPERSLFFDAGVRPEFFGSPRGTPVDFPLASGGGEPARADYIMHPLQVQGDWMQVRVTSPSDYCASPSDPEVSQKVVWIRYLDDRGRPRVWYYTRGC